MKGILHSAFHHSSLVTHHSSLITHHSSLITHHSSLVTHYSLLITHHSSMSTNNFITFICSAGIRHLSHHRLRPCSTLRDHQQTPDSQQSKPARKPAAADRSRDGASGQCRKIRSWLIGVSRRSTARPVPFRLPAHGHPIPGAGARPGRQLNRHCCALRPLHAAA